MPYKVEKRGSKFCVVKKEGGKSLGCHDSREKALKQMRAVYAREGGGKKQGS